uniref:Plastocyanin (Fragments) n=1 Tax=Thalassiosira oceanica TaxID=159749 RepID=PLAS_THAOC|nr:RecName: Full=Plastocyanin [Thalassiosira oceanica]
AQTVEVKMGADGGLLVFEPAKAGPHNVVFDEDNIPPGV